MTDSKMDLDREPGKGKKWKKFQTTTAALEQILSPGARIIPKHIYGSLGSVPAQICHCQISPQCQGWAILFLDVPIIIIQVLEIHEEVTALPGATECSTKTCSIKVPVELFIRNPFPHFPGVYSWHKTGIDSSSRIICKQNQKILSRTLNNLGQIIIGYNLLPC